MSKYAVIDLEMCKVTNPETRKKSGCKQEIIQIGAVLLDEELRETDSFMSLVHPRYGFVDSFIETLTGISQGDVENAPDINEALSEFFRWLPSDAVIVSWSPNDKKQLTDEISVKHLYIPEADTHFKRWIDCQETFGEKMNNPRCYKLSEALVIANIYYEDGAHDALVDAKNTAKLFKKMETEEVLELSPYISTGEPKTLCYSPFADLLSAFASA